MFKKYFFFSLFFIYWVILDTLNTIRHKSQKAFMQCFEWCEILIFTVFPADKTARWIKPIHFELSKPIKRELSDTSLYASPKTKVG